MTLPLMSEKERPYMSFLSSFVPVSYTLDNRQNKLVKFRCQAEPVPIGTPRSWAF